MDEDLLEDSDLEYDEDGDLEPDEEEDEFRVQWASWSDHFELVQDDTHASRATGSVQSPRRDEQGFLQYVDGYLYRSTCGATFISPHYAVTAAHCVQDQYVPDPDLHTVEVQTYDISTVSLFALWVASHVEGMFPDYVPLAQTKDFAGYDVQSYDCRVKARCGSGQYNCDFGADIALLHCPSRPSQSAWIPVASSDPMTGPVEMYWFHEVLMMPTADPGSGATVEEHDRYQHYTRWNQDDPADNYHYLDAPANTLLPLRSVNWPNAKGGGPRTRLGGSNWIGGSVRTDLFGCHGTSGSGVFQRNAQGKLELLGPVVTGAQSWRDLLCNDPDAAQPGELGLRYLSNASTKALYADWSLTLYFDRNPIVYEPPGPLYPW